MYVSNAKLDRMIQMHLDNCISARQVAQEEKMKRIKIPVVLPDGKKVWLTGNTYQEAIVENGFKKYAYLFVEGAENPNKEYHTIEEYSKHWYETYKAPNPKCSGRRLYNIRNALATINQTIGQMAINEFTVQDAQEFFAQRAEYSRWYNGALRSTMQEIFNAAIEEKIISENPLSSKLITIVGKVNQRKALTHDEVLKLIADAQTLPNRNHMLMILLPIHLGLRPGEIAGLRWEDIDFDNNIVTICRAVSHDANRRAIIKTPKTKNGTREIAMPNSLKKILLQEQHRDGYVLHASADPEHYYTSDSLSAIAAQVLKKLNVGPHVTLYNLRHTFATELSDVIDAKTLQTIMGHATFQFTYDHYVHAKNANIQQAGSILEDVYTN